MPTHCPLPPCFQHPLKTQTVQHNHFLQHQLLTLPPMSLTTTAALANTRLTSYESDPDLSKTVYYSTPANPSHPLVQYTLMIDAGSTGSRIHIYKFNNCGTSPTHKYEVFMMIQHGLSSLGDRPLAAAESLDPLMDKACQSCTGVAEEMYSCCRQSNRRPTPIGTLAEHRNIKSR